MPAHAMPPGPEARARRRELRRAIRRRELRRIPRNVLVGIGVGRLMVGVRTLLHTVGL